MGIRQSLPELVRTQSQPINHDMNVIDLNREFQEFSKGQFVDPGSL